MFSTVPPGRIIGVTEPRSFERTGRRWTIRRVARAETADSDSDFDFRFDALTPEQRVEAVHAALESSLKARGVDVVPGFRGVHRRVERT
jgi:hypothetical protein